jgi:hypothetical protein
MRKLDNISVMLGGNCIFTSYCQVIVLQYIIVINTVRALRQ